MIFDPEIVERAAQFITHIASVLKTAHPGHHVPTPDGARRQATAILNVALSPGADAPPVMTAGFLEAEGRPRPLSREVRPE